MKVPHWSAAVKVGILNDLLIYKPRDMVLQNDKKFLSILIKLKSGKDFLMSSVAQVQPQRTGGCPHGLSPGACPICSGMGGGGSARRVENDKPKSAGEWSWMQCYTAGQMMKAQRENAQESRQMFLNQLTFAQRSAQNIAVFVTNMQNALQNIQKNLPVQLQAVFGSIVNNVLNPLLNLISKIPAALDKLERFMNDLKEKIADVSQKLTALLGEVKNFIERKLADNVKKLAKRLMRLFIWGKDEEHYRNDEELEIFKSRELRKLKNIISKLGSVDIRPTNPRPVSLLSPCCSQADCEFTSESGCASNQHRSCVTDCSHNLKIKVKEGRNDDYAYD